MAHALDALDVLGTLEVVDVLVSMQAACGCRPITTTTDLGQMGRSANMCMCSGCAGQHAGGMRVQVHALPTMAILM